MGLLASGADTSLFCSFFPFQLCPPYLFPCTPGCPRTSRLMPLFPAPSNGQARAGEALPTAPLVTSALGRIPTLGGEGWAERVLLPLWCLAERPTSGERKGLGEGGGGGGDRRPKSRPLGQMLTQWRAPGPRGARAVLAPSLALGFLQRERGGGAVPAPFQCLSLRLGLEEEPRKTAPRLPGQGGGQPIRGPWVGWVGRRLRERALSKPGLRNWPGPGSAWLQGKPHCLLKGAPTRDKVALNMKAGSGAGS